jgi:dethiobiotin synthetase
MSKNIFITATGTDVGKTYVSALIVKKMRDSGYNCGYFKPVLSGVVIRDGKLLESDCNYVVNTANIPVSADDCVVYRWEEAVSPHLAAERANQKIDISLIKKNYEQKQSQYDYLLIEGAGGITCPLKLNSGDKYLLKDLIKELEERTKGNGQNNSDPN